ncbi:MAG: DUF1565 domain-containing protein, partial [Planctomycetes bacterium]|nr:DUF1565 domain-containing protein [Planctomycetota bacterium]
MKAILTVLVASVCVCMGPARAADYYVSSNGDDAGPGSAAQPFRTIQKAADVMNPGDTCHIRRGTYRETVRPARSGEAGKPIRFVAYENEPVTISGAEVLKLEWAQHKGDIFKATTDGKFIQLFVDGKMMFEARWPNSPLDDIMAMNRAKAGKGTDYTILADPNLPPGDWNGAVVLIWPGSCW